MSRTELRALRAGTSAVLVETRDGPRAQALHAELLRRRAAGELPGVTDIVPAARTVLVTGLADPGRFAAEVSGWDIPPTVPGAAGEVVVPVRFDGPDTEEVARAWRTDVREVRRVLTGTRFRVAFCGFAPGFGYLTGLPDHLPVPRRATPRTAVPAGAVALAGPYAGVYPRSSPGGWQVVGTTDAVLWDPGHDPAALLAPGTDVRFTKAR